MIFKTTKNKLKVSSNRSLIWIYATIVLFFGLSLVTFDYDEKIDSAIRESNHRVEKELDVFWDKLTTIAHSRNFLTNLSFNVNLAATTELDNLVEGLSFKPNIFVYDSDRRYFGKNDLNHLNRFDFRLNEEEKISKYTDTWRYFEANGLRYIQRFKVLENEGTLEGYLRVVFSLEELQRNLLERLKLSAHLSVRSDSYAYVRCSLSSNTDLHMCVPVNAKGAIDESGTLMAFVGLFWAFLVFIVSFYLRGKLAQTRAQTLVEVSSQVSHDIQSPLLALKVATKDLKNLPEEQRLMVQRSISRIEDIVNDLKNKRDDNLESKNKEDLHLLYGLVNSILSEKRLQFKYRNIELDLFVGEGLQTAFVHLSQKDFKRVLSNIINNAVEAIPFHGNVGIEIEQSGNDLVLRVVDNGSGMPEHLLREAFLKGVSEGKEKGQGLGLYHAKKMADIWGASLSIESEKNNGTSVELRIPRATAPTWFPEKMEITEKSKIVILDDDQNIHEMWVKRFENHFVSKSLVHFYHVDSAENRLSELLEEDSIFLVDYELIHSSRSGLDFIVSNNLMNRSVLVTARYDDEKVISLCHQHGVNLLPKVLMNEYDLFDLEPKKTSRELKIVPNTKESEVVDLFPKTNSFESLKSKEVAVLIDDDPLVRKVWEMKASSLKMSLRTFSSTKDFMSQASSLPMDADIYVDVDLGGVRGDLWSKELAEMGFKNLYLTTGFEDIDLSQFPWLKDRFSKEPPF